MGNDLKKTETNPPLSDGFDGYEDAIEGSDQQERPSIIQGTLVRFTNDFCWMTSDDDELSPELELLMINVLRVVQKWVDDKPVETIVLEPGQRFPDIEKMNEAAPRSEWTEKFGKLTGPWQRQHVCYLLDPALMAKYTYPTGSTGGAIAISELVDRVKWMRKLRGAHVYPVVTLATKPMRTAYGGRERPYFVIKRWVALDDDGNLLPPPTEPSNGGAGAKEKPVEGKKAVAAIGKPVTTPSLAEEMNDDLPF
jgi:hypothetical protein